MLAHSLIVCLMQGPDQEDIALMSEHCKNVKHNYVQGQPVGIFGYVFMISSGVSANVNVTTCLILGCSSVVFTSKGELLFSQNILRNEVNCQNKANMSLWFPTWWKALEDTVLRFLKVQCLLVASVSLPMLYWHQCCTVLRMVGKYSQAAAFLDEQPIIGVVCTGYHMSV